MTQEEKRIAIAKACGWTSCFVHEGAPIGKHPIHSMGRDYNNIPYYFSDLDACHEMEKGWASLSLTDYAQAVKRISADDVGMKLEELSDFTWINAHPAYRAEAFGQTLNLWKETENEQD
jgi:hypothetical protein